MFNQIESLRLLSFYVMQDEGLDFIAEGLDTLKDMAEAMNEVCWKYNSLRPYHTSLYVPLSWPLAFGNWY